MLAVLIYLNKKIRVRWPSSLRLNCKDLKKIELSMISAYSQLLKDSRWTTLSARIKKERGNRCEYCGIRGVELHLHHGLYIFGRNPWDYDETTMWVLCKKHHALTHQNQMIIRLDNAIKNPTELNRIAEDIRDHDEAQAYWNRRAGHEFQKQLAVAIAESEERPFTGIEVTVYSSDELASSQALDLMQALEDEFPGLTCNITLRSGNDCAVSITIDPRYLDPLAELNGDVEDTDYLAFFELEQEAKAEKISGWAESKKRSWGL